VSNWTCFSPLPTTLWALTFAVLKPPWYSIFLAPPPPGTEFREPPDAPICPPSSQLASGLSRPPFGSSGPQEDFSPVKYCALGPAVFSSYCPVCFVDGWIAIKRVGLDRVFTDSFFLSQSLRQSFRPLACLLLHGVR